MKRRKLFTYLYAPHVAALLVTLLAVGGWALHGARQEHYKQTRASLEAAARMLAATLNQLPGPLQDDGVDALCATMGRIAGYRFTVIRSNGRVIGDSQDHPAKMDDHAGRPEIRQLFGGSPDDTGWSVRRSETVRTDMMYVAVPWHEGGERQGFVRAARAMDDINLAVVRQRVRILYAGLWLAVFITLGSALLAGYVSAPLARIRQNVETYAAGGTGLRLPSSPILEIHVLGEAMNAMARRLDERVRTVARQRDEQQALFACMTEAVIAMDNDGMVLSINPAAARMFGVQDEKAAMGRPVQEVVRHVDLQNIRRKVLSSSAPVEEESVVPDGNRTLRIAGTTMADAQGRPLGCVLVMTDITRMRQLETMRKDFVANVSHELKTPVTSIRGFADTLLEGASQDAEKRDRFLGIIQQQARRLTAILEDLLTLSRLEHDAKSAEFALRPVCLLPLLQQVAGTCRNEASGKAMMLAVEGDPALRADVNVPLMEQALINLVANAVKYSPPKTRVCLAAERRDNEIWLRVSDQGPGIARHHLPRLFERFYRVDKGRSRNMGGTGLGLAIVKSVAIAHGGRVEVESFPGRGSTFSIVLPLRPACPAV